MAIIFSNGFGIGASNNGGGGSLSFFTNLNTIVTTLRNNMSDFRNPDYYFYDLDGDGYYINDGGGDMMDSANATTPWLRSNQTFTGSTSYTPERYPYAINYVDSSSYGVRDTSFGYQSLGYASGTTTTYQPLTVIGTRATNATPGDPIGFQSGGNIGADNSGIHVDGNIYTGNTVSGFTVHAFYSETYDASDPSVCDVFILLGHPSWNSVFGNVYYGAETDNNGNGSFLYTSGNGATNILAIKTLLSKDNGVEVTFSEVQTVVDNFIARIYESQNFSPPLTQYSNNGSTNNQGLILSLDGSVALSGNTILDQSGYGNNLAYNGVTPEVYNSYYYDFNSNTIAQSIGYSLYNNLLNTMSMTMWVNFPTLTNGASILSRTSGNSGGWALRVSSNQFNLVKYNEADQYSNGSFTINTNTWYHIGVVQGGGSLMFTLNGQIVGSVNNGSTGNFAFNNNSFFLCYDGYINTTIPLKIAKLKIWDTFKTSSDILTEFNSEKTTYGY